MKKFFKPETAKATSDDPALYRGDAVKGLKAITFLAMYWPIINVMISCCGIVFIYNQIRALMETPAWYLHAVWYDLNFDPYIPKGVADFTNNTMFRPVSRLSSQFLTCFSNTELMFVFVGILLCVLSFSLNLFLFICGKWKECPPEPENAEWQEIWRGLGKILEAWGPAMSWDFTLEHLLSGQREGIFPAHLLMTWKFP